MVNHSQTQKSLFIFDAELKTLWVVTAWSLGARYQHFRGTWRLSVPLRHWSLAAGHMAPQMHKTWYESSLPWKPHILLCIGFEVCKHFIAAELKCQIKHKISDVTFFLILLAIKNNYQPHVRVCTGHNICSLILKQMI